MTRTSLVVLALALSACGTAEVDEPAAEPATAVAREATPPAPAVARPTPAPARPASPVALAPVAVDVTGLTPQQAAELEQASGRLQTVGGIDGQPPLIEGRPMDLGVAAAPATGDTPAAPQR